MDDPVDHTSEHLPMAPNKHLQNSQQSEIHPTQLLKTLSLVTVALVVVLAALSYGPLTDINEYQGKLLAYLPIHSGEIEYSRLPQEYWEHRIRMIKAMGLNSVSIYVMWNHHQKSRGQFDFTSPGKDLAAFLNLTQQYGLQVLLRPGPYVCAEWDFGGLPARLLGVDGLEIRSPNALYEAEVKIYFSALAPIIKPFLAVNGGNIILLQIENQYGYFGDDNQHILNLLQMWKDLGIDCQFYLEDPAAHWQTSYWPGAHLGLSQTFSMLRAVDIELSPLLSKGSLVFGGEVYSGWFTSWGFDWGAVSVDKITSSVQALLEYDRSFSLYMIFGGTNFGVSAGANGNNGYYEYLPHITSYDYDSPITEQGRATTKFMQLRQLMQQYYGAANPLPQIPDPIAAITLPSFRPELQALFWSNLPAPKLINSKLTFFQSSVLQMYGQGLVVYDTFLPQMRKYEFKANIRDFALIFVDQTYIRQILRRTGDVHQFTVLCHNEAGCRLRVLVEAMGHKNFGKDQATDRKGLIDFQAEDHERQYLWNITTVSVNDSSFSAWTNKESKMRFPAVYRAEFSLHGIGDTYFDMSLYKKGYLSINGHLLGRYWSQGPQQRLFCPGVWLYNGTNVLTILQLLEEDPQPIQGYETLKG